MRPIEKLLDKLEKVFPADRRGPQYSARCPAHDDRGPSLRIRELDDGRVLLHCQAGCEPTSVLSSVGLSLADLFPGEKKKHALRTLVVNQSLLQRRDRKIEMLMEENRRIRNENHAISEENIRLRLNRR